jgi:peptidoglycan/LPS O-acetylase OafA/YrhL
MKFNAVEDTRPNYYPNFDWLRLAFAIQVVAIHCGLANHVLIAPVPAFLAISGFVVLGSIERRPMVDFYISRALRVLPLLFLSFAIVGFIYGVPAMLYNIKYWIYPDGDLPANPVVWTLFLEEVFYFLLSILFVIGVYKKRWPAVLIFFAVGTLTATRTYPIIPAAWYVLGSAFLLGNIAYQFRDRIARIDARLAIALLFASASIVFFLPYVGMRDLPYTWMHIISFSCMLIFALAGPKLPRLRIDVSYSMYLFHALIGHQIHKHVEFGFVMFALVLVATMPVGLACWYLIERPALRLKSKLTRSKAAFHTEPQAASS